MQCSELFSFVIGIICQEEKIKTFLEIICFLHFLVLILLIIYHYIYEKMDFPERFHRKDFIS